MNILYLTNHLNIGGITSYVLSLATGLKKRGHNIYVASSGGQLLPKFIEEGINYICIPIKTKQEVSPKILASMLKLKAALKSEHIDIIHSNSRTTQVLGYLFSQKTGVPHIFTCHGFFKKRFFRKLFPCWGRKTIAISESVKEHLIKDLGVKEEDISVVHNGIDVEKFKRTTPAKNLGGSAMCCGGNQEERPPKILAGPPCVVAETTKESFGLGEGPVVGIVARLSDVKGHIYLIEAMKDVLEKVPQAQLLIVGEGKMEKVLVRLSERLGIKKNVFLIPSISQTMDVLSIMDVFVMPSLKEGLGLALMEAMASGLAVIGSDVGGIKSLIQNGYNGLLVRPADSKDLAAAILELLQNPERVQSLGNSARVFIAKNFSLEKMISETEEVYKKCVSPRL